MDRPTSYFTSIIRRQNFPSSTRFPDIVERAKSDAAALFDSRNQPLRNEDTSVVFQLLKAAWGSKDSQGETSKFAQRLAEMENNVIVLGNPEVNKTYRTELKASVRLRLTNVLLDALQLPSALEKQFRLSVNSEADSADLETTMCDLLERLGASWQIIRAFEHATVSEYLKFLSYAWGSQNNEEAISDGFGVRMESMKKQYLRRFSDSDIPAATIRFNDTVKSCLAQRLQPHFQNDYQLINGGNGTSYEQKRADMLRMLQREIASVSAMTSVQRRNAVPDPDADAAKKTRYSLMKLVAPEKGKNAQNAAVMKQHQRLVNLHLQHIIEFYRNQMNETDADYQAACRFFLAFPKNHFLLSEQLDDKEDHLRAQVVTACRTYIALFSHHRDKLEEIRTQLAASMPERKKNENAMFLPHQIADLFMVELDRTLNASSH